MGLIGMIGKMAGSKVVKKVENELVKKQNREQTSKYFNYIKNNLARICALLTNLRNETQLLVDQISSTKGLRIPFKERGEIKKTKEKATKNLQYLYLSRDFFTALSKNASGIALQNEELMLVSKFAPFFDGVPILDLRDNEDDESLLDELKSLFISTKKDPKHFDFKEYLCRYEKQLEEYAIPDMNGAIETFKNTVASLEIPATAAASATTPAIAETSEEIECPNCHAVLGANSKFCPECGTKIEIKKPTICAQCGEPIAESAKFCANCGAKI
ncbi:MAG: zinc ribbon domain-containing protein [Clostridia bacterium]|nr:zinc ribbon domain-containing protein [Clostridia bacterium]